MIKKHKVGDEIKVGEYVNFQSIFTDGLCGRAHRVNKVSGQRIYYVDKRDGSELWKLNKTVVYVSTHEEDAEFLFDCSCDQMKAIALMNSFVKDAINERINAK